MDSAPCPGCRPGQGSPDVGIHPSKDVPGGADRQIRSTPDDSELTTPLGEHAVTPDPGVRLPWLRFHGVRNYHRRQPAQT